MKIVFVVTGNINSIEKGKICIDRKYKYESKEFNTYEEAERHIDWIKNPGEYKIEKIYIKQ